jgi:Protein of unknown function (DUF5818)
MIRKACIFAGTFLVLTLSLIGQDQKIQSSRRFPADDLAPGQLIAWTWMQQPQPMPQLPRQADNIPPTQSTSPSGNSQERDTKPTFIGKIEMQGNQLIFRTTDGAAYALNAQEYAKQYEGRNVRLSGLLNPADNSIHIIKIELLP